MTGEVGCSFLKLKMISASESTYLIKQANGKDNSLLSNVADQKRFIFFYNLLIVFNGLNLSEDSGQGVSPKLMSLIEMTTGKPKIPHLVPVLYLSQEVLRSFAVFQLFVDIVVFIDDIFEEVFAFSNMFGIFSELLHHLLVVLSEL